MVRKRIADYDNEITELTNDTFFAIDRPTGATAKISYLDIAREVSTDVSKADTYRIEKVSSTNYTIKSDLFREKNISSNLYDGLQIEVLNTPYEFIQYDFQDAPNPNVEVNDFGSKPVYNGFYYDLDGRTALDRNTFWGLGMHFVYNQTLDAWLLYKSKYNSGDVVYLNAEPNYTGFTSLLGQDIIATDYPILSSILGTTLPDLANTSLAGVGDETPALVVSEGQIEEITGDVAFLALETTGNNAVIEANGAFALKEGFGAAPSFDTSTAQLESAGVSFHADRVVNTGAKTLTRRYGLTPLVVN